MGDGETRTIGAYETIREGERTRAVKGCCTRAVETSCTRSAKTTLESRRFLGANSSALSPTDAQETPRLMVRNTGLNELVEGLRADPGWAPRRSERVREEGE